MPGPAPANGVFLNVPFDAAYRPIFEALVFCVIDCGYEPRCALETSDELTYNDYKWVIGRWLKKNG